MFLKYTPDDYDKHGYLKAPIGFYLVLVLLMRAYVIWILSLANRRDSTSVIEYFYPNQIDFFIGLATGIGAALVMAMVSLRRENAYQWLEKCWPSGRWLLWISWTADLALTLWSMKLNHFKFAPGHAMMLLGLFFAMLYMFKSERIKDLFADWPEKLEKKDKSQQKDTEDQKDKSQTIKTD